MRLVRPTLFVMVGLPGSGKTTRALQIESETPALRLTPDEWLLPLFGPRLVPAERDVLEGRLIWLGLSALRCGIHVVFDFGVWSRDERRALRALASSVGAPCELVYLEVDEHTQADRIAARQQRDGSEGYVISPDDLAAYRATFEPPSAAELDGEEPGNPPDSIPTWSAWASARWPGLTL